MAKKKDSLLDEILEVAAIVKDKILAENSTVEVKEMLAYMAQMEKLRAQNFKISPDEEVSGLDKLRRRMENGNSKRGGDRSSKTKETTEAEGDTDDDSIDS